MIYLGSLVKETDEKYRVGLIHYKPFDLVHGIKKEDGTLKTEAELRASGALVAEMPKPEALEGQIVAGTFYNPFTGAVFYEYVDKPAEPKTEAERLTELEEQMDTLALSLLDVMGV